MHLAAAAILLAASLVVANNCPRRCVRREFRALSHDERTRYFRALRRMKDDGRYDQFARNYNDHVRRHHNGPGYFAWHRAHLREFERALQEYDSDVCLHYWSWDLDASAPECSPVWHEDYYGVHGDDGCVRFSWHDSYRVGHENRCLRRGYDRNSGIPSFHSYELINRCITQSTSYDDFRSRFEEGIGYHPVHNIGGDIAGTYGPSDPIYYAHATFVDKVYDQWQRYRPEYGSTYAGNNWDGQPVTYEDRMEPYSYTARDVLSCDSLCYGYEDISYDRLYDKRLPDPSSYLRERVRAKAIDDPIPTINAVTEPTTPAANNNPGIVGSIIGTVTGATDAVSNAITNVVSGVTNNVASGSETAMTPVTDIAGNNTIAAVAAPATTENATAVAPVNTTDASATPSNTTGVATDNPMFNPNAPVRIHPPMDSHARVEPLPKHTNRPSFNYDDRSQVIGLRRPRPCSDEYMQQWGYRRTREYENEYFNKYDDLNRIYGYVSPNSFYYRPDLFACAAPRVKYFYVDVADVGRVSCDKDQYDTHTDPYQIVADVRYRVREMVPDMCRPPNKVRDKVYAVTGPYAGNPYSAQNFMEEPHVKLLRDAANSLHAGLYGTIMAAALVGLINV